jgi:hypothetical protein
MITTSDVANIVFAKCRDFGISKIYQKGGIPLGKVTDERIVIIAKGNVASTYWKKGFVEVNLNVPNISGEANLVRLNALERMAYSIFDSYSGKFDSSVYHVSIYTSSIEEDSELGCHFVNIRLLFEILNVK